MERVGIQMNGLSLHYYTCSGWDGSKGSALVYDDDEYYWTLGKCLEIEDVIKKHCDIMDEKDPQKRIGLLVDEWGTWWDEEPGTVRGHLYQQNTMRDALVAAISLNVFHRHCDRVRMANIAQVVNVLQAVILTEGAKMIKTPTYHVFKMYSCHQDNELLESSIETEQIGLEDKYMVPNLTESVSKDKDGKIHITLTNLSVNDPYEIETNLVGSAIKSVKGSVVAGKTDAHNTFDDPDVVKEESFDAFKTEGDKLIFKIPSSSVMHIEVTV
jgi:alpha-N-arabinofuranosidase